MRGKTCVEKEAVRISYYLCIRRVLIKNAHQKSLWGEKKKKKHASLQYEASQKEGKTLGLPTDRQCAHWWLLSAI